MTLLKFEKLGRNGQPNTMSLRYINCDICHVNSCRSESSNRKILLDQRHPGGDVCPKCWRHIVMNSEEYHCNMSKAVKKFSSDPEYRKSQSISRKGKINLGDSNGMKSAAARAKVSATRKKKFAEDPEFLERHKQMTRKAWADGKYEGAKVGTCKWYNHIDNHGTLHKLQGTWELKYAQFLDSQGIRYISHRNRLPYIDVEGVERSYYPDFYLIDSDEYVEIKSSYWLEVQGYKVALVRNNNPHIKLRMLTEFDLRDLGIDVPIIRNAEKRIKQVIHTNVILFRRIQLFWCAVVVSRHIFILNSSYEKRSCCRWTRFYWFSFY